MSIINGTAGADTLNGTSGDDSINGYGGDDVLNGLEGNDTLNGGAGADAMHGGAGNDTYLIDNIGDLAIEAAEGDGIDLVKTSISFALGLYLENLTLQGTAAINATGNDLANILIGNAGSNILDGGLGADKMQGGAGHDTYIVDNVGDRAIEVSATGGIDLVQSTVSFTLGAYVENIELLGTAAINATGNTLNNYLIGNSAANILNGGAGADTMQGGGGNDIYLVDNAGDVVFEDSAAGGTDLVKSSVSYTLGANVENLTLNGTAGVNGTGNGLANLLTGNDAANILDGKGGADTMKGGAGDDTYVVDNVGDKVVEFSTGGIDTVNAPFSYTLGNYVEHLVLAGAGAINGTGNDLANTMTGNVAANVLHGAGGDDVLNGGGGNDTLDGGAGADAMAGGLGDDTYYTDDFGDAIIESDGEGTDTVRSARANYTLDASIENALVVLAGGGGLYGNNLGNQLTGSVGIDGLFGFFGDDTLDGGAGDDRMEGGLGNDTYYVDSLLDIVDEFSSLAGGGGTSDKVFVSVSGYTLTPNIENGTLLVTGTLTGNGSKNILTGTNGNDTLFGGGGEDTLLGGAGADTMDGGAQSDVYYVDDVGDVINDTGGDNLSVVNFSLANYTLQSGIWIAKAQLTTGVTVTGNAAENWITGNLGSDVIDGLDGNDQIDGGAGNDTLTGGLGNDQLLGNTGIDTMIGGAGNDTYSVDDSNDVAQEVSAGDGTDLVRVACANYVLGAFIESAAVEIIGDASVAGNGEANVISGNQGNDTLIGGSGGDTLNGNSGNDILQGDDGADTMTGGAGADIFDFNAVGDSTFALPDTVQDFTSGTDIVDLSGIDANALVSGDQAFTAVAFSSGTAGEAWTGTSGAQTFLFLDVNGGGADMRIILVGAVNTGTDVIW